jgi:hypothetical protein
MSVVLEAALHYAGRGIPVFPCNIQKRPLTVQGFKDASTDKAQIRAWWEQHPNAIIGLPTGAASGLAVIDLDHKPNKFGIERNGSQALLEITQGEILPDTVEARTPTGGRHIYVRNQPGFKCSTDDELGIDVRAEGGYVCVPPSPGYSFEKPFDFFPVIEAPECLIKILTEGTRKRVHEDHAEQLPIAGPVEADDTRPDDVAQILNEAWNPDDYHDWSTAALALHGLPDGYAIWSAWAARSPKFNVAENLRKWNQTQPTRGIGPKSILARASKQRLSELGKARQQPQTFAMFSGQGAAAPAASAAASAAKPPAKIRTVSFLDLLNDHTPDEPDYIEPNFLGPGMFGLIAGPPKAQKSFLLTEMLIAAATGTSFLGGLYTVPRPLKVFYLQAEMGRKLLKKRAQMMTLLAPEQKALLGQNLVITERFHMLLDEAGVRMAAEIIMEAFPDGGPDIIAIDPLANLFDGESEDKAPEVMAFLTGRIDALRRMVNPAAAILMVHHSAKKNAEDMNRDPFVAIRGSGALRGYYDTGIIIYRKSEEAPERKIFIECRNGESPEPITVRLTQRGTFEVVDTSMQGVAPSTAQLILDEIRACWNARRPLSTAPQTRKEGRHVGRVISAKLGVEAQAVESLVEDWLMNGVVAIEMVNTDSKMKGLKVIGFINTQS